jgi:glycosyltransferase involved in cell wall biosynthesis
MKLMLVNAKQTLADALTARFGLEPIIVWPRSVNQRNSPPPGSARICYYSGGAKLNLRAVWEIRRLLQHHRPEVVHAFYGRALAHVVLAAMSLAQRPKIVSFRGILSPIGPRDIGDWLSYRHPLVAAHACESDAVRRVLIRSGLRADRCWTTYNTMYHWPTRRPGRTDLAQFRIPPEAFIVGTMAAMRPVKGIDLLLRAAIRCADLNDVYFLLFGEALDPAIRQLAADPRIRDRVRLVGHRPDASELISGADVFVMPSRSEALCQALLEAMYQGLCPVVSDAGGMPEVVRHQQDGLVVPSENVAALAQALRTLHADRNLVTRMGASAERRIADSFTPEKMAERTFAIYRSVLSPERERLAA